MPETAYGILPDVPSFKRFGEIADVTPGLDPNNLKHRGLGSRDLAAIKRGLRGVPLKVKFVPQNTTFIGYAVDITKSFCVELQYFPGLYILLKGLKVDQLQGSINSEDYIFLTADMIGQDIELALSPFGTDYEAALSATPLSFENSYLKKNTAPVENYYGLEFTIKHNLKPRPVIRATDAHLLKFLTARQRDLTGKFKGVWHDLSELTDIVNDAEFDLEVGWGTSKWTFNACKWDNITLPAAGVEPVDLDLPWTAKTYAFT